MSQVPPKTDSTKASESEAAKIGALEDVYKGLPRGIRTQQMRDVYRVLIQVTDGLSYKNLKKRMKKRPAMRWLKKKFSNKGLKIDVPNMILLKTLDVMETEGAVEWKDNEIGLTNASEASTPFLDGVLECLDELYREKLRRGKVIPFSNYTGAGTSESTPEDDIVPVPQDDDDETKVVVKDEELESLLNGEDPCRALVKV